MAALKNASLLSPALFWVAVQADQLFSGTNEPTGRPGANVSRSRIRWNGVLHLHDTVLSRNEEAGNRRSRVKEQGCPCCVQRRRMDGC